MTTPQGSRAWVEPNHRRSASAHRPEWQDSVLVEKRTLPSLAAKKMSERTLTLKKIYGNNSTLPPIQRSLTNSRTETLNGRLSQAQNNPSVAGSSRSSAHPQREQALHELLNVVSFLKTNCKQLKRENAYLNTQVRDMKQSHATEQASTEAFQNKHKDFEKEWNRQVLEFSKLKETFTQQSQSLAERDKEIKSLQIDGLRSRINELRATVGRGIAESFRLNASIVNIDIPAPSQLNGTNGDHLTFTKDIAKHTMQQLTQLLTECESRIRVLSNEAQKIIEEEDADGDIRYSLSKLLDKLSIEHTNFEKQCEQITKNIEQMKVADNPPTEHNQESAKLEQFKDEDKEDDHIAADFIILLQTHKKRLHILKTLDDAKEHELAPRHFEKRPSDSLSTPEK